MIDLRSDTVTRPTPGMREAIAAAEVGDDSLGDDPTVRRLQERVAALLGKEEALFFPSGIMANETAVLVQAPPGTEVVLEATSHIFDWEDAAAPHWGGVQLRPVATPDGLLTAERVRAAVRPSGNRYQVQTSLLCVENTHNGAGGKVLPLESMRQIRTLATELRLPVHLDGARLWNAAAASGVSEATYAAEADTVMVALSKGLGCPVGSLLAGPSEVIRKAWRIRRRLGGSMRQAGILAAAGLYALDHHRERLVEDHRHAQLLAELVGGTAALKPIEPETNIVMFDILRDDLDAPTLVQRLAERGLLMTPFTARRVRAVTHLDVDEAGIRRAAEILLGAVA